MNSRTESGHAINVANDKQMISFVTSYGAEYNPPEDRLKLPALNSQYNVANILMQGVITTEGAFDEAVNTRMDIFNPFSAFSTRLIHALKASGATVQTINDAKAIHRKIQGVRAIPKPKKKKGEPGSNIPDDNTISAAQMGYDNQVQHLSRFIDLLATDNKYAPNEADLSINALEKRRDMMKEANDNVGYRYADFKNAIIARDAVLYAEHTGIVDTSKGVKSYLISVYGTQSEKFKQVNRLRFRNVLA